MELFERSCRGDPLEGIRLGQTILDRVLFIAFAEDNGLLPDDSLFNAFLHRDPYHPKPVWQTFLGLFNAIDRGNEQLRIPRYNGGLFQPNAAIDALALPDHICEGFKRLAEYDFASEISVTVLGHIFEQSIADVEQLHAEALGEAPVEKKTSGTTGRRKRDGVVYTPDYVARFIVDQTLGTHCKEIFAEILIKYAAKAAKAEDNPISWKSAKAERAAWEEYLKRLTSLRIVDPACGSGVFLIMAFDYLKAELQQVNTKLAELSGVGQLFDPDSEILTHNLFGVDVNSESVEIAKLSLWIKTARRGKVLDSLDANLRVGDSLIEDSSFAYRSHGFEWKAAFSEIFKAGGFDVVLGNPPYVRMELIKPMKPWLQKRYEVVSDRADLYAYFFERGIKLLKPGGRLGFISSSTFFKTASGAPLRDFLRTKATLEAVVDFGDHQIFDGVTTYPAVLTMRAGPPPARHDLRFWEVRKMPTDSFADAFADAARPFPQEALGRGSWELEGDALRALRDKIKSGKPTLKEVYGSPLYGIKTGLNEAFIIDTPTKEKLCRADPRSADLLKPFLEGKSLKRWRAESRGQWIIYIPRNRIDIEEYPAIRDWLLPFKERLERRATKQAWFELQQSQERYALDFVKGGIAYPDIINGPQFVSAAAGSLYDCTVFFLATGDDFLAAFLNSNVFWFCLTSQTPIARGGYFRAKAQYLEPIPMVRPSESQKAEIETLVSQAQLAALKRYELQQAITRRIPDLALEPANAKLTSKLKEWWTLPDFAAFQQEVQKALKVKIPLLERNEWETWTTTSRSQIQSLSSEIERLEVDINTKIYALFDLTAGEIAILEANIQKTTAPVVTS